MISIAWSADFMTHTIAAQLTNCAVKKLENLFRLGLDRLRCDSRAGSIPKGSAERIMLRIMLRNELN
jgi:excinuclease UvrABC ATPase subunit